jgi:fructose-1,6-bisphosphatase
MGPAKAINLGQKSPNPKVRTVLETAPMAYVMAKAVVHFLFSAW